MDDANASAAENLIDSRGLELPALLRNRYDRLRGRKLTELLRSNGPPDPRGIQLFSNDYLSLANHPNIVRAMLAATSENTDSLWMASVFFGDDSPQRQLERRLAAYLGTDDSVLMQSGYCANVGLLLSIAAPGMNVYIDELAHGSLWHGVLASRATPLRFAHNEPSSLDAMLQKTGPGIVVVDSVYSHDGSVSPLRDITDVTTKHDSVLIVDESHSLGTHGPRGAGMVAELALEPRVHFRTASLAKAFVSRAGLVAGSAAACWGLRHSVGPAIFSSACLPHDWAGIDAALELIASAEDRRQRLRKNASDLRERLSALGYPIASRSHIIALVAGVEDATIQLRRFLEAHGIYGSVFCAPVTRLHESLIRLSINAGLTEPDLDRIAEVCRRAPGRHRSEGRIPAPHTL
jgi:CAI-1 autoinducer synthase